MIKHLHTHTHTGRRNRTSRRGGSQRLQQIELRDCIKQMFAHQSTCQGSGGVTELQNCKANARPCGSNAMQYKVATTMLCCMRGFYCCWRFFRVAFCSFDSNVKFQLDKTTTNSLHLCYPLLMYMLLCFCFLLLFLLSFSWPALIEIVG